MTKYIALLCLVLLAGMAVAEPVVWDTVATSSAWDTGVPTGSGENIALSVANNGEMGQLGIGGVNLDFYVDGGETGTRPADRIYLRSGSLFLMRNDGDSILLTTSIARKDWTSAEMFDSISYDFVPVPEGGPMSSGVYECDGRVEYDSVFVGRFLTRDSSVAVEQTYYANRLPDFDTAVFVIVQTKIFAGYKGSQSHLSIGTVIDWDIPADRPAINSEACASEYPEAVFAMGTDTSGGTGNHASQLGAEMLLSCVDQDGYAYDTYSGVPYGSFSAFQSAFGEESGTGEPDAQAWWNQVELIDFIWCQHADTDLAVFHTYRHDFDLSDSDTLIFTTALVSTRRGTTADLSWSYFDALVWNDYVRVAYHSCCFFRVGDLDHTFEADITDLQILIDNQFLSLTPIWCPDSGDLDFSGTIDITDVMVMVDHLFLTLTPLRRCPGKCYLDQ